MADSSKRRVVAIAIDASEHSDNAFQWYCDYIYKDGDFLVLIHIPETYDLTMASPSVVEQLLKEIEEGVHDLERKYRDKLLSRNITGKFRSTSGKPGEKIVTIASEENATFIVTGTRGLGKFRRTIMGSVSDYIVHHASMPVLVCRWKSAE
ncbi:unnamed protein product [Candidula unifasciata]|uniref:UspA domain-containing protein n=1 Tax=Candidula unifasciata TaxID=100452 RepID=A0A8S3Z5U6_9EUPU|nr:unnamed protein product [Candidula unifasciata]